MAYFLKDPQASLDYAVDWGAGYLAGQLIATSSWAVEPDQPGGVRISATIGGATRTGATIEGGEPGKIYRVGNSVTLTDGRIDERSITLRVEQR